MADDTLPKSRKEAKALGAKRYFTGKLADYIELHHAKNIQGDLIERMEVAVALDKQRLLRRR